MTQFNDSAQDDKFLDMFSQKFGDEDKGIVAGTSPTPKTFDSEMEAGRKEARAAALSIARQGLEDPMDPNFGKQQPMQDGMATGGLMQPNDLYEGMVDDPEYGYKRREYDDKRARFAKLPPEQRARFSQGLQEPTRQVSRRDLRDRFGLKFGPQAPVDGIKSKKENLSDADYNSAIRKHYTSPTVRRGTFADPKKRKAMGLAPSPQATDLEIDRGMLDIVGTSLLQGIYTAGEEVGGYVIAAGAATEKVFGETSISKSILDYGMTVVDNAKLAQYQTNIDPTNGLDYGPLPDSVFVDTLRAAPRFLVDVGLAIGTGGGSVVARLALGTAAKYTAKQSAKRSARVFAGLAGAQTFGRQYSESYQEYVKERGMKPNEAYGVMLAEALSAGAATALTTRISADFLFTSKAARGWATATLPGRVMRNFMIGFTAESMQEITEQVLADAALASIAAIRDDPKRLAQVGFLKEGYLYKLYRAGAAGGLLGGPAGVVLRGARPSGTSLTPEEQESVDVANFLDDMSETNRRRVDQEEFRQFALAEERQGELSEFSETKLWRAIESGIGMEENLRLKDGTRVGPLVAVLELKRRGIESGKISQQSLQDLTLGKVEGDKRVAAKKSKTKSNLQGILEQKQRFGTGEQTIDQLVETLVQEEPDLAMELGQLEGESSIDAVSAPPSRGQLNKVLSKFGITKVNSSKESRAMLRDKLGQRFEANVESQQQAAAPPEIGTQERAEIELRASQRQSIDSSISEAEVAYVPSADSGSQLLLESDMTPQEVAEYMQSEGLIPENADVQSVTQRVTELRRRGEIGSDTEAFLGSTPTEVQEARRELQKRKQEQEKREDELLDRGETKKRGEEQKARDDEKQEIERQIESEETNIKETKEATKKLEESEQERANVMQAANRLAEQFGEARAKEILSQVIGGIRAGFIESPDLMARMFYLEGTPFGIAGTQAFAPVTEPTRAEATEAQALFQNAFDQEANLAENPVTAPVPEDIELAEETETFPNQGVTRVSMAMQRTQEALSRALQKAGLDTSRLNVFVDGGPQTLTDLQKEISDDAKQLGITVVFYEGAPPEIPGYHNSTIPGVIAINRQVSHREAMAEVFLHEALHELQARNPGIWNRLLKEIRMVAPQLVRQKLMEYESAYNKALGKNSRAGVSDAILLEEIPSLAAEIVADIVANDLGILQSAGRFGNSPNKQVQKDSAGMLSAFMQVLGKLQAKFKIGFGKDGAKINPGKIKQGKKLEDRIDAGKDLTDNQRTIIGALVTEALESMKQNDVVIRKDAVPNYVQSKDYQAKPKSMEELSKLILALPEEENEVDTEDGKFSVKLTYGFSEQDLEGAMTGASGSSALLDVSVYRVSDQAARVMSEEELDTVKIGGVSGTLRYRTDDNLEPLYMQIQYSEIEPDFLGYGIGLTAYRKFIDRSLKLGLPVRSDGMVSPQAVRVYRRLVQNGYQVNVNPNTVVDVLEDGVTSTGHYVASKSDSYLQRNIFEVMSGPVDEPLRRTESGNQLAEALAEFEVFGKFSVRANKDLGTDTRPQTAVAVKKLQKVGVDLNGLFTADPQDKPRQYKAVKNQLATVFADLVDNGNGTERGYALLARDSFGLTDAETRSLDKSIANKIATYYKLEYKPVAGGLHPKLYQESRSDKYIVGTNPLIPSPGKSKQGPQAEIDARKAAMTNVDLLLSRHANPFADTRRANEFLTDLYRSDTIPIPPTGLIANLKSEKRHVAFLSQLTKQQEDGRRHGLEIGDEINRMYASGDVTPAGTGQLMVWGMLSRMLSPFPHESAALQFFSNPEFAELLEMSARGDAAKFTKEMWKSWGSRVKKTLPKTAKGATSNINAVFETLLPKLSQVRPDGRTYLQAAHDAFSDTTMSGKQLRRFMMSEMPVAMGIDIKVISFLMLLTGRQDVLVMDRVQITNMFDDGRLGPLNVYDGKKDVGSGLSVKFSGIPALAMYEAMEGQIEPLVKDLYTKAGLNPDEATLGAYHWDTWNIASGQAATHGSLSYLVAQLSNELDNSAPEAMGATESRYGSTAYNLTFVPSDLWTDPDKLSPHRLLYSYNDNVYEFTPVTWREIALQRSGLIRSTKDLPRKDADGRNFTKGDTINEEFVLDDGTNPLQDKDGNRIPWYEDDKILKPNAREDWTALVEKNGIRADSSSIDASQATIDPGTLDSVIAGEDGGRFSIRDGMPRDDSEATPEQLSMLQRLNSLRRSALGDAPPVQERDEDILLDDGPNKGPGMIRLGSAFLTPLHYTVLAAKKGSKVISSVRNIISLAMDNEILSQRQAVMDTEAYNAMPAEWKEKQGYKFAQLMDQYVPLQEEDTVLDSDTEVTYYTSPESAVEIKQKVRELPQAVQDALLHFRQRSEEQRLEIVTEKRDFVRTIMGRSSFDELRNVAMQEQEGRPALYEEIEVENIGGTRLFATTDRYLSKEELIEELVVHQVPSDWGNQYSHYHHAFFGKYKLKAFKEDGSYEIIGDASTQADAYQKLKDFKTARGEAEGFVNYEAKPAANFDSNAEIVKMTQNQRNQLRKQLKHAADLENTEITNALRGVVGLKQNAKPFYAPMMQRSENPAQGFSMNFARVWQMQNNNFNRWKFGGKMVRATQPIIEELQKTDPYWAEYLSNHLDRTLFIRPTATETAIDTVIRGLPVIGKMVGDMPTRRTLAAARTMNFLRQLKTPRQWAVNSIQPLQTVLPKVGEKTFVEATAMYNSAEGKALLDKIGKISVSTGMYIDGSESAMGEKAIETVTRGQEFMDKHILRGKISSQSEVRNMNFSAVAFFLHGKKLGKSDADAAQYARIEGYVGSQFAYTRANLPPILNGPIASTLLQYRRFQFNMIGYGLELLKSGNYSGAGRWLLINTIAGGVKGVLFTLLPGYFLLHQGCKLVGLCDESQNVNNVLYQSRRMLRNQIGEDGANALIYGMPALLGTDISGSLSLFTEPYGKTTAEQIKNQFTGPTLSFVEDFYDAMTADTVQPVSFVSRTYRTLKDTGPAFKWLAKNAEYFSGIHDEYDDRGRLRYSDVDKGKGIWMQLGGGFRTVNESIWSMEFDRLQILKEVNNESMSKAAMMYAANDIAGAIEEIKSNNAAYPMMSYTLNDLDARVKNAREAMSIPQATRRVDDAPKRVEQMFRMENMR